MTDNAPPNEAELIKQALLLQHDNKTEAACEALQAALVLNPANGNSAFLLGSLLVSLNRFRHALMWLEKALVIEPVWAEALAFKAHALASLQQWDEAAKVYKHLVSFKSDSYQILSNYSQVLRCLGEFEQALQQADKAILLSPGDATLWYRKGVLLGDMHNLEQAVTTYQMALRLQSDYQSVLNNLCIVYTKLNQLASALECVDKLLALSPGSTSGLANKASLLLKMGEVEAAVALFEQAAASDPASEHIKGMNLFAMNFLPTPAPDRMLALAKQFGECVNHKIAVRYTHWLCPRDGQTLRIGVVSGDLRSHPVGYFSESLLTELAKHNIELHAFTSNHKRDALTDRLRPHFKSWTSLHNMRFSLAAKRIHDAGIHVLIDLAGHTNDNLLPVFGYKPAPVQVSWLGYSATIGMSAIDHFLCSDKCAPVGEQANFLEPLLRLSPTHLCFTPPPYAVEVAPLPAQTAKTVTFGCFNKLAKLNARVLDVWSRILAQVPKSRLLLKTAELGTEQVRNRFYAEFARRGIDRERLLLEGSSPYEDMLRRYHDVDLVLDPFPYPGGTTSVEAMWMGVPVLTLAGTTLLSRQGAALAQAAGQKAWVAKDEDDYVKKACYHAKQRAKLAKLRAGLRDQLLQSPLFDAPALAAELERTFRHLWQQSNQQWQDSRR